MIRLVLVSGLAVLSFLIVSFVMNNNRYETAESTELNTETVQESE